MNIPKKIHLTCKNKNNINNIVWKKCLEKYKLIYPDYEIIIYDNEDIYNIIQKYYPEYLLKVKQIKIGAILADIFRYLILYLEGGIYSDFDCEPIKRIDELLNPNFKYYHSGNNKSNSMGNISTILGYEFHSDFVNRFVNKEWCYNNCLICQWFMITEPKQDIFIKVFNTIMNNIDSIINI